MANSSKQTDIEKRINQSIDYIDLHLDEPIELETLADVACFSKHHFHRCFKSLVGIPPNQYVNLLKMKRGLLYLICRPSLSITDISERCGQSTLSNFSRSFNAIFGVSPKQIRQHFHFHNVKNFCSIIHQQFDTKPIKHYFNQEALSRYHGDYRNAIGTNLYEQIHAPRQVIIEERAPLEYIYSRAYGSYNSPSLGAVAGRHFSQARSIYERYPETMVFSAYLDRADYTPKHLCRFDAGITVPSALKEYDHLGRRHLAGGHYARLRVTTRINNAPYLFRFLLSEWLPCSAYEIDDRPTLLSYLPLEEEDLVLTCHIPIILPRK